MSDDGTALGARLRERDLSAAPAALNLLESATTADREQAAALLREVSPQALGGEAPGHVIGITGPPGAGKSTLLSALLHAWRAQDRTVAMLAVDPSSRRSGGALLGDRARIEFDAADRGVLIRSTAAGERLGGLAWPTRAAAHALAAAFDVVVVETVGVGQAETEIVDVADTVAVVVQPGSGDALQFLKSGIMEIPDVLVVTKADLGQLAVRTRRDLSASLRSLGSQVDPRACGLLTATASGHPGAPRGARGAPRQPRPRGATTRRPAGWSPDGLHRGARRPRAARAGRPSGRGEPAGRAGSGPGHSRAGGGSGGQHRG